MATHDLLFLGVNKRIPRGKITSTAREGLKWYDRVRVGDLLNLIETETNERFAQAVCIGVHAMPLGQVIAQAPANHAFDAAIEDGKSPPALYVRKSIAAAYGDHDDRDIFSVVQFLVISE